MIRQSVFGKTKDGKKVLAFTFENGGSRATVLNLGGILQSLIVPDKNGNPVDVILGYATVAGYEENGGYLGALIGRFGNRIGEGKFVLEGKEYSLYCNDRGNHLHGGKEGFDKKIWAHRIEGEKLYLSIVSPDGEENYPGNLNVTVCYTFAENRLTIEYDAQCDQTTLVNLTNHAYFNLNGEGDETAADNFLFLDSDYITPTDDTLIPRGGFRAVAGPPFDFNTPKPIGREIDAPDPDLVRGGGYDHCYVLKNACGQWARFGVVASEKTGITMKCYTDMPAVQFYAGNGLNQEGKSGHYGKRSGFCLETQAIPNNVNVPEYAARGSSVLEKGKRYHFSAAYQFTTI